MNKPQYETVEMTLSQGDSSIEKKVSIDKGKKVFVRATAKPSFDKILNISILENGSEIHPPMDISNFDGGVGSFEQRGIELPYSGGSEVTVRTATASALGSGESVTVQVNFLVWTDQNC